MFIYCGAITLQCALVLAKSGRQNGRHYFTDIIGLSTTTVT